MGKWDKIKQTYDAQVAFPEVTQPTQRLFVIQEHNAKRAGLHWDLRFESHKGSVEKYLGMRENTPEPMNESQKVLRSFAVPKHRLPGPNEKLLAMPTEDHPWDYKDFHGVIPFGYGAGTVKLLFSDNIEVSEMTENKIKFTYQGVQYVLFEMGDTGRWLIKRK